MVNPVKNNSVVLLIFFSLMSCTSTNSINGEYLLETAIFIAAREIHSKINPNDTIAVLDVYSTSSELSVQLISWLENYLLDNGKYRIVSRRRIDTMLEEQNLGLSGHISDDTAQSIGKLLGADYVSVGDIKTVNNISYLNIQTLETETALLIYSNSFRIKVDETNGKERNQRPYRF